MKFTELFAHNDHAKAVNLARRFSAQFENDLLQVGEAIPTNGVTMFSFLLTNPLYVLQCATQEDFTGNGE
jgi:hypothetical protein